MVDLGSAVQGLSEPESAARLATDGPNELARASTRGPLATGAAVLKGPLLLPPLWRRAVLRPPGGARLPADAAILACSHLEIDESLLTGESVPVRKRVTAERPADARPGGDDQPFVFAGTLVARGGGLAEVLATGPRSEMGRIGTSLGALEIGNTPLQDETSRIVKIVASAGLMLCAALVVLYGLTRGNWLQGLLAGIALAMA